MFGECSCFDVCSEWELGDFGGEVGVLDSESVLVLVSYGDVL